MSEPTESNYSYSLILRIGAHVLLAWSLIVWPLQWHQAYAQGLPGEKTTTEQRESAVAGRTVDKATEDHLTNQRARKLAEGWKMEESLRAPNLTPDTSPVRTPNLTPDPSDAALAARAASKHAPLQIGDLVQGAQRGSDFAQGIYSSADVRSYQVETNRVDPGQNDTAEGRVNVTEIMPGYNAQDVQTLRDMGGAIYQDPSKAKEMAEKNKQKLKRSGCRKTDFILLDRQDIAQAPGSAENRILKVEFFDLVKEPIPNTNPVEYTTVMTPSTYKKGTLKLAVPTIGGSSSTYWDRIGDDYAIRYTYTPYTAPRDRNFFTYRHQLGISHGGSVEPLPENYFASYGTPDDGFTPSIGYTVPQGVTAVYLSADLYRTDVSYTEPAAGAGCPPDPPQSCEVSSVGGDTLRWCAGSPGASVLTMYDDRSNPDAQVKGKEYSDLSMANAGGKNYRDDAGVVGGVMRGLNAGSSSTAQELAGLCTRDTISRIEVEVDNSYHQENIQLCSETLVNPYPDGCNTIKRSYGMSYLGEHNFLTVRAFNKKAVPIIDPQTGQQVKDANGNPLFTYVKEPANVKGGVLTNFRIIGAPDCPRDLDGDGKNDCTTEILPDDPLGTSAGYYIEYDHTPMGGDPFEFAADGVFVQAGGSGNFSHYGLPDESWVPTGSASGDDTLHELRLMAKLYAVTINTFAGCEKYMQHVADGFCQGGKLTCVDTAPTRSVGGVTFGPGLPNSGIVDILKKWGTDSSAVFPDYSGGGAGVEPTPTGPEVILLDDQMCWEAVGEPFTTCETMSASSLKQFTRNGELWATDCHITPGPDGVPLESSGMCKRSTAYDGCDSRFLGLYTGVCYNPTLAYDCGEKKGSEIPVIIEEKGDSCSGAMRCLGTECHRPNLAGANGDAFAQAVAGMEALNMAKMDMICAETGEPPKNTTDPCTPMVFGGKAMYCKIPIGHEIGITPNCCKETEDAVAASDRPTWMDYLNASMLMYQIGSNAQFQKLVGGVDVFNSTSKFFGEIAQPITDAYGAASEYVTKNLVEPFNASFDSLFGSFGGGGAAGAAPSSIAVDSAEKGIAIFGKGGVIHKMEQLMFETAYKFLKEIGGDEFAKEFIAQEAGEWGFANTIGGQILQYINLAFTVYQFAKLIGHIIFACKPEEYEWAMNNKWRLCTYVGDCCSKKALGFCVEKRRLHCCYKSIAGRVIAEQIIKKGLLPSRDYRTAPGGGSLSGCDINCGGFTPMDLALVDWSRVDLSEWLDAMVESGFVNLADPRTNYGAAQNKIEMTQAVGRTEDTKGEFDQRIAATKTAEGMEQNMDKLMGNTEILRNSTHCYKDDKKMPYTYPECKQTDCGNVLGSAGNATTNFEWIEDGQDWLLTFGTKQQHQYPDGSYDLSGTINIKDKSKLTQFVMEWLAYDDWLRMELNGTVIWNGPNGGDTLELCPDNRVRNQTSDDPSDGCDWPREIQGPHGMTVGGITTSVDLLPLIQSGSNSLKVRLIVGGVGDFVARFRTTQKCGD